MDVDSDDDGFYAPVDHVNGHEGNTISKHEVKMDDAEDDEEEGEEVEESEEDSDDEVTFIIDSKEQSRTESSQSQPKRPLLNSQPSTDMRKTSSTPIPTLKTDVTTETKSTQPKDEKLGTDYPGRHTSKLDPNGNPVHPTTGKPIQSTDFDVDFPSESSKPWRKPGSDITDYFNYGFDEFTWASYCLKQQQMPKEIKEINAQAEQMKAFVEMIPGGGMPAMPGMPPTGPSANNIPAMPGEAEMQQMFQAMMSQGMDPTSMDTNQFMQMMMSGGAGGPAFPGQAQGFGGGQAQQPQQAQMGFNAGGSGFDQGGNFPNRARGRGGRRNW